MGNVLKIVSRIFLGFISVIVLAQYFFIPSTSAQSTVGSWTKIGLSNLVVSTLVSDPATPSTLYAGTSNGVYKSTDSGNIWLPTGNQGTAASVVVIAPTNPHTLYATLGNTGIQKSTDGGITWTNVTNNFGTPVIILDLAVDSTDMNTVFAAPYGNCLGVRKTSDGGTTWNSIGGGCDIFRLVFDPTDHNILYVGGTDFSGYFEKNTNGTNAWTTLNQGLDSPGAVHGIAIDSQNTNSIYVGDEHTGVYKTINGGINWNLLPNSPDLPILNALAVNPSDSTVFAKSATGVSKSTDGGTTWTAINTGNVPTGIEKLIVLPNNPNTLYAATDTGLYAYGLQAASPSLNVPLFKQGIAPYTDNNPSWEADAFGIGSYGCGTTIAQCGCAMTSSAMIFKYYHIDTLPDGATLDPGTLNTWLKNNKGYFRDEGMNPYIAATIAKKAKNLNPNFAYDGLEYSYLPGTNTNQLTTDITNGIPDVLEEPGHFIVGKGIDGNSFTINDPFYSRTSLTSYNNSFISLGRFTPSHTDMSYIVFAVDADVTITVTNDSGTPVGDSHIQYHINNPDLASTALTPSLNIFAYPKPETGSYHVQFSSPTASSYQLDEYLITKAGDYTTATFKGPLASHITTIFSLAYDKQSTRNSAMKPDVTFDTLIADIQTLRVEGKITNQGIATSLIAQANAAKKSNTNGTIGKTVAITLLKTMQAQINSYRGKLLTEPGYQILTYDLGVLLKTLQGI